MLLLYYAIKQRSGAGDGCMQQHGWPGVRNKAVLCTVGLLGAYFLAELAYYYILQKNVPAGVAAILLLCLAAFFVGKGMLLTQKIRECRWPEGALYAVLAGITILPRLFLMLAVKVVPQSDYAFYYDSAASLAGTGIFPVGEYNIAVAPNTLTFIGVLGGVFKLFGTSVFTAQLFNLALITGAVWCFYGLARRLVTKNMAILAAALFALSPNSVLFSLCVASEPLALLFFLWGLYLAVACFQKEKLLPAAACGFLSGVFLGFSNSVRSNAMAALLAVFLYAALFLLKRGRGKWQKGAAIIASIAAGFLLLHWLSGEIARQVYQTELGISFGWALYEGLDEVGNGGWTPENSAALYKVMEAYPPEQVQGQMLRLAMERIEGYDLPTWIRLLAHKGLNTWVYTDYAYGAVLAAQDAQNSLWRIGDVYGWLTAAINILHHLLLALFSVHGLILVKRSWRRSVPGYLLLLCLPILGFVIFHSLATSIPRYQYMAIPLFILAAACMLEEGERLRPVGAPAGKAGSEDPRIRKPGYSGCCTDCVFL